MLISLLYYKTAAATNTTIKILTTITVDKFYRYDYYLIISYVLFVNFYAVHRIFNRCIIMSQGTLYVNV